MKRLFIFAGLKALYRVREVSLPDEFAGSRGTAPAFAAERLEGRQ